MHFITFQGEICHHSMVFYTCFAFSANPALGAITDEGSLGWFNTRTTILAWETTAALASLKHEDNRKFSSKHFKMNRNISR